MKPHPPSHRFAKGQLPSNTHRFGRGELDMANKLSKNDRDLLTWLAEYRLLTISQIAALGAVGKPATRNRVAKLAHTGLTEERTPGFASRRGRPERWVSLTDRGVDWLRDAELLDGSVPTPDVAANGIRCTEHLLAINWFRVHLVDLLRILPQLEMTFLSSTSPFVQRDPDGRSLVSDHAPATNADVNPIAFTPDGVFLIRDRGSGKALLFFLEVDRGTETLISKQPGAKDIHSKVLCYRSYFRSGRYKRYEEVFNCTLNGFRLLFVTESPTRLTAMCRLVQELRPSDFIWLTDHDHMFAEGLSASIWARGGNLDAPPQSIVGQAMSRVAPVAGPQGIVSAKPGSQS
jgi:hypothetical protein